MTRKPANCHVSRGALLALALLLVPLFAATASAITIPTVPVGNAGNPNQSAPFPYGGVAYDYRIGTTEVTVAQYTAFLNAVAATDTYGLYDFQFVLGVGSHGIVRNGSAGSYTYSTIFSPNYPLTYVTWGAAARFANWLHNGQPSGAQDATTTEDGAYTLNGAVERGDLIDVTRNAGARWFIPSENEWFKAAYYQPAAQGGDVDGYWLYPMRTNTTPYSDQPPGATPDNTRVANFLRDDGLANGYNDGYAVTGSPSFSATQNYLTDVGAYSLSTSFYGTYDQGGNVAEWTEAVSGASRVARGGYFGSDASNLRSSMSNAHDPTLGGGWLGFRVASLVTVPEPDTALLAVVGAIGLLWWSQRRK
jgi:formylglycine-generating enzyme required for sulfatase activity